MAHTLKATQEILDLFNGLRDLQINRDYFIADSSRVVLKLIEAHMEVSEMLATQDWYDAHPTLTDKKNIKCCYQAEHHEMQKIVGFTLHQGVMARLKRPSDTPLDHFTTGPLVVMDGISKSDNVGAIIRNAAAFGINHILIDSRTCHPFHRRAIRTSMGNILKLRAHQTADLRGALKFLKASGTVIVGFENRPHAHILSGFKFPKKCAIVIGSEAEGISSSVLNEIDELVKIPIEEDVYALNAACAASVAFYAYSSSIQS